MNASEKSILDKLEADAFADSGLHDMQMLDKLAEPITGEFVSRLLLMDTKIVTPSIANGIRRNGLQLIGWRIEGAINLDGRFGPEGGNLPALTLHNCIVSSGLFFARTTLRALSLRGSRVDSIRADECEVLGSCDLRDLDMHRGRCFVSMNEARIGGDLLLIGAHLAGSPALNLRSARIAGAIVATPANGIRATFYGGISLENASVEERVEFSHSEVTEYFLADGIRVGRSFRASQARFLATAQTNVELPLFNLANSEIESVDLKEAQIVGGTLSLSSARITRFLRADKIRVEADPKCASRRQYAFNAGGLQLGDAFMCAGAQIFGGLSLGSADIGGSLSLDRTIIRAPGRIALAANNARIGGFVELRNGFRADGETSFAGTRIGGNFAAEGATLNNPKAVALSMVGTKVDGSLYLRRSGLNHLGRLDKRFAAFGVVRLASASVAGQLDMTGAHFVDSGRAGDSPDTLDLRSCRIGQRCLFSGTEVWGNTQMQDAVIGGSLILDSKTYMRSRREYAFSGANLSVAGDLIVSARTTGRVSIDGSRFAGSVLFQPGCEVRSNAVVALSAENVEIGRDLQFYRAKFVGDIRLDRVRVAKETKWKELSIRRVSSKYNSEPEPRQNGKKKRKPQTDDSIGVRTLFSMPDAHLGLTLNAQELDMRGAEGAAIDMRGAFVVSLADVPTSGWGDAKTRLVLDGFRYDQVVHRSADTRQRVSTHSGERYARASDRVAWLRKQQNSEGRRGEDFHPQPYTQAARTLSGLGFEREAREILLARARLSRRRLPPPSRFFSWMFDVLFEYGLSNWAATRALAVSWLVGAFAAQWAATEGRFVPTGSDVEARTCGQWFVPGLYAADTLLPLVDLRIEGQCEIGAVGAGTVDLLTRYQKREFSVAGRTVRLRLPRITDVDLWRTCKALYAIWGWVVASLAILTFSGFVRRFGGSAG